MAGRTRRAAATRRRRADQADARLARLRRARVREAEQAHRGARSRTRRASSSHRRRRRRPPRPKRRVAKLPANTRLSRLDRELAGRDRRTRSRRSHGCCVYQHMPDAAKAKKLADFMRWALTTGRRKPQRSTTRRCPPSLVAEAHASRRLHRRRRRSRRQVTDAFDRHGDAGGRRRAAHRPTSSIEGSSFGDRVYRWATTGFALVIPILLLLIALGGLRRGLAGARASSASASSHRATGTRSTASSARRRRSSARIVSSIIALLIATPLARRRRDLPLRVRADVAAPADRVSRRSARRDSERRLRSVGHPRARAVHPRARDAVLQGHAAPRRLPAVLRAGVWAEHARGGLDPRRSWFCRTSPRSRARCCWPCRARSVKRRSRSARRVGR